MMKNIIISCDIIYDIVKSRIFGRKDVASNLCLEFLCEIFAFRSGLN